MWRISFLSLFLLINTYIQAQELTRASKELKLMGTRFVITATAVDYEVAKNGIEAAVTEVQRIERLISSWDSHSETSEINVNAGIAPVTVRKELYDLISRSKKISELTSGAFDISFASMEKLYVFDKKEHTLPERVQLDNARSKIDWKKIHLNEKEQSVFLKEKGMRIGFGGIGKGYAANQARKAMENIKGVEGGIVNASGDLSIWGKLESNDTTWTINIADPSDIQKPMATLEVANTSVVTSGDYEQFFMAGGKRYSHIIDPKTALPTSGIKSVTIVCKDAEVADALATSIFVLGIEDGLYLVNHINGIETIIITDDDTLLTSDNIQLNYFK